MAQADLNVANQSGSAFRADLNNQLLALGTLMSGASEPSTTYAYMLWADTSASVLKMRNAANNGWIILRGLEGKLSVGSSAPGANVNLRLNRDIAGATTSFGQYVDAEVAATVTASAIGIGTSLSTAASTSLSSLIHYQAATGTLGAGTSITNQIGFSASSSIDGATNDFGFYGNIAAGNGNWNCYMVGAAPSFFNHQVQINAGSAGTPSLSTNGDTDTGIHFPAANSLGFATGGTERMRLTSTGLGIGTTSASFPLQVHGSGSAGTQTAAMFRASGSSATAGAQIILSPDASLNYPTWQGAAIANIYGGSTWENSLAFKVNKGGGPTDLQEVGRWDPSGRLLVGTSTNHGDEKVLINGSAAGAGNGHLTIRRGSDAGNGDGLGLINFADTRTSSLYAQISAVADATPGTNDFPGRLVFSTTADGASSPTERMRLSADSGMRLTSSTFILCPYAYNTTSASAANMIVGSDGNFFRSTSSARYKTDIETLQDQYADVILDCRPVWYRSTCEKDNPTWGYWGFIAEEVAEVDPRLVFWKTHETIEDEEGNQTSVELDEPVAEGVQYDRFVPHLLNLIKRQKEQIEAMEARLSALEAA